MQRIKEQLQTEYERYSKTIYGKLIAVLIYYLLITQIPRIISHVVPYLLQFMSPPIAYIVIIVSTMASVTVLYNGSMYFVYTMKLPFFERYRVNSKKLWPWEENYANWKILLRRSIKYTLFDIFVVVPTLLYLQSSIKFQFVMDVDLEPSLKQTLIHLCIMQFFQDLIFFSTHWALHQPFLYKYHKIHHQYTTTVSIAGLHSHLVEFLLSNSISAGIYMKIACLYAPLHVSTATIWIILRIFDAYNGHSGYNFSWTPLQLLPFCANDEFHDYHHSHNCGNYGSQFRFLDSIFGTNKAFRQYKKQLRQEKKHEK